MNEFVLKVYKFVVERKLIEKGDRVLAACSGGPDSMALLKTLIEISDDMDFEIGIAHLDHGIRNESIKDLHFVKDVARSHKIPFFSKSADIKGYAERRKLSLEEAARKRRYEFLEKTAENKGFNKIAIGHNYDDNVETVILNLIRGTGISGLKGITAKRNAIIRPLLSVRRKDILKWLRFNKIEYIVDKTNKDITFTRNRIRLRLLPYIRKHFNPDFDSSINRLSMISGEVDNFITTEALEALRRLTIQKDKSKIVLDLYGFIRYDTGLRKIIIRETLKKVTGHSYPPDYKAVKSFSRFCETNKTGKMIFPGGAIAELIGGKIVIGTLKKVSINKKIEFPGEHLEKRFGFSIDSRIQESVPGKMEYITEDRNIAYFDLDKLGYQSTLRNSRIGDKIKPLGMTGHKSVMDILAENGIPSFLKESYLVLTAKNKIAWIVGVRTSEDFKIDSHTRRTLRLEYAEQDFN